MRFNLDANATFGLHPEVLRSLTDFLPRLSAELLNPSSIHRGGQAARTVLDAARYEVRRLLGAQDNDAVIFTSGATEANNHAVLAPFLGFAAAPGIDKSNFALVTTCVEHESVADAAQRVAALGFPVRIAHAAAPRSWISADDVLTQIDSTVKVVSLIHGQNEIGAVLPIAAITSAIRKRVGQALIHLDAVQTVGRMPVSLSGLGVDALSLSGHKLGGLAGAGALVVRHAALELVPALLLGGAQEQRRRAGTENLSGIFSLGVAARVAHEDVLRGQRMRNLRELLRAALCAKIPGLIVQGEFELPTCSDATLDAILPNTLCVTLPPEAQMDGADLVVALDMRGVQISTGSACSSGKQEGNRTLRALGFSEKIAKSSVRLSVTGAETSAEILSAADAIAQIVARARSSSDIRAERAASDRIDDERSEGAVLI